MNSDHPTRLEHRKPEYPLRQVVDLTHDQWDRPSERDAVRDNFRKVLTCRTPALGGEVYASASGEKVFYHTCKSKCCPQLWQSRHHALAAGTVVHPAGYTLCRHCPHHARRLLAGLQSPSPPAA